MLRGLWLRPSAGLTALTFLAAPPAVAETVRVEVDESYSRAEEVRLPYAETAAALLARAGHAVSEGEADSVIAVRARGGPKGATYVPRSGPQVARYLLTGAALEGTIEWHLPGGGALRRAFKARDLPPSLTHERENTRDEVRALMLGVYDAPGSFTDAIAGLIGERYGIGTLAAALHERSAWASGGVQRALLALGGRAIGPLIDSLATLPEARTASGRDRVVWMVGRISPNWRSSAEAGHAMEALVDTVAGDDAERRDAALEALDLIDERWPAGDAATGHVPALVALLDTPVELSSLSTLEFVAATQREWTVHSVIRRMGEPAVPALIDRLRSSDLAPRTRRNVAGALSSVGRPAFEPALALFETAADPEVRAAALQVAAATGGQEAAEALLQATGDASAGVRVAAASGLGALRETRAGSVLADLVARADEDPAVRQAAATALRALGSAPAAPLLAAAGDRRAPLDVRLYAAGLAAGLDAVVAAPALLAIAADTENPALLRRVSAGLARPAPGSGAEAMARAGSGGVRDAFTAAEVKMVFRVAIDDPLIRELVPQLLAEGGGIVRPAVLALVAHPLAQVRRLAARTLGGEARDWKVSAAAREAVPLWLEALADADEDRRLAAAKALGGTADARALEPLLSLLAGDPATLVRGEAATAVGAIGVASADPRALAQLLAALADPEDHVRYMAAESLGRLRNAASVEPLIALLGGHRGLQVSAARALAEIGDPRALEPLRTARSKVAFPGDIEAIDAAIQKLEAAQP